MNKKYGVVLAVFFLLVGPGPIVFFLNKYTIPAVPLIALTLYAILLKDEILACDFNAILKDKLMYFKSLQALKYCIFAHALCSLLFKPVPNMPESLITAYPIMPFYTIVFAPIFEEVAYRKIIFQYLDHRFNFWAGSVVSSAIFAIGHFSPDRVLAYFGVGMILCFLYKKTKTIFSTIVTHMLLNLISVIMMTIRL